MFTSDFGEFRRKQAVADLRHHARSVPLATVRRIGAGIDMRGDGATLQQRLEWYFRGKVPPANLRGDPRALGALLMSSALPDEDFDSFVAATVLLLLERLTSETGPDNGFWSWRRLAPHYRLARPPVRAAVMCGFREARRLARIAFDEGPEPGDCLTASTEKTLAALRAGDHPALTRIAQAIDEETDASTAGALWVAQHDLVETLSDDARRAAHLGFRHLYERPLSIHIPPEAAAPVIPIHD